MQLRVRGHWVSIFSRGYNTFFISISIKLDNTKKIESNYFAAVLPLERSLPHEGGVLLHLLDVLEEHSRTSIREVALVPPIDSISTSV